MTYPRLLLAGLLLGGALAPPSNAQTMGEIDPTLAGEQVGIYSTESSYFRLRISPTNTRRFHYGSRLLPAKPPRPVAGDFNGNNRDSVGVFENHDATWHLGNKNGQGKELWTFQFGTLNSEAITGNWNGAGGDGVGTYQPTTGQFSLRNTATPGSAEYSFTLLAGSPPTVLTGGHAVSGDFNGNGKDSVGIYDPNNGHFYLTNADLTVPAASHTAGVDYQFGPNPGLPVGAEGPPLLPVFADWNFNGKDTPAVYEQAIQTFHVALANVTSAPVTWLYGSEEAYAWYPVAGRWNLAGSTGEHTGFAWPQDGAQGMAVETLNAGFAQAGNITNLHSLVVCRNGYLVKEKYFHGFDATMGNSIKSVSKSLLSAMFGIGLAPGGVLGTIHDSVVSYLPGYVPAGDPKEAITLRNILTMRSGLDVQTGGYGPFYNSTGDWMQYVLSSPLLFTPGTYHQYSLELTHLGYGIIQSAATAAALPPGNTVHASDFADEHLLGPLEISTTRWDRDPFGVDAGGFFMRPRDMARFGQLFLDQGTVTNTSGASVPILPASWVADSTSAVVPKNFPGATGTWDYGYWWWRGSFAGHPTFFGWGYGGQFIFVVPSKLLVVVATSDWVLNPGSATITQTYNAIFALMNTYIVPAAPTGDG